MRRWLPMGAALALFAAAEPAWAARAAELAGDGWLQRAARFFTFRDESLRLALAGSLLLGACCGAMGTFLLVRRLALLGDALAHAVLPGVALGFLWTMRKEPLPIFLGAVAAGFAGAGVFQLLRVTTRHKEDAALGFVLSSFFAAGVCLLTTIQNLPGGAKAGLDRFLFGQAAALGEGDVVLLAVVAMVCAGAVALFPKEFLAVSFDPGFARVAGLPAGWLQSALVLLLAFAIVAALQAVGVVLVSAMLVIPAATALLLSDRFWVIFGLAAVLGMAAGALGAFFSFTGPNFPTGPFMVLSAATLLALALVFSPRQGILPRLWLRQSRARRIDQENLLKAFYHVLEREEFRREVVGLEELAIQRRATLEEIQKPLRCLIRRGLANEARGAVMLTPAGWRRACEIVRNHRLWELYLTHAASYAPDHVHEDAEAIEHVLGEDTVLKLEKRLKHARRDPHGRLIPGPEDIRRFGSPGGERKGRPSLPKS